MPVGEECMASQQCEIGLRCVEGACVEILLPGETCEASAHCALGLGCIDGRCRALPDVGEPCFEEGGCIRGDCDLDSGVCSARAEGDECGGGPYYRDVFDPCGDTTTCGPTGTGTSECQSEGSLGSACGTFLPPCPTPEMTCNSMEVCAVVCAANAPDE
jgi:hypothetical protein